MFAEKARKPLTHEKREEYEAATKRHKTSKNFRNMTPKVRDHCHYTGQYRGPVRMICSLTYKIPNYIFIIFHNLNLYDANLFIRELGKEFNTGNIGVIAENKESISAFYH